MTLLAGRGDGTLGHTSAVGKQLSATRLHEAVARAVLGAEPGHRRRRGLRATHGRRLPWLPGTAAGP